MRTNNTKIHFDFVEKLGETTKTRVETRLPWRATWRAFIFVRANSAFNRHNRGEYRFWATSKCVFNVLFIRINTRSSLNHHCCDGPCTLVTRSACLKRFEERLESNRALWFDANARKTWKRDNRDMEDLLNVMHRWNVIMAIAIVL